MFSSLISYQRSAGSSLDINEHGREEEENCRLVRNESNQSCVKSFTHHADS